MGQSWKFKQEVFEEDNSHEMEPLLLGSAKHCSISYIHDFWRYKSQVQFFQHHFYIPLETLQRSSGIQTKFPTEAFLLQTQVTKKCLKHYVKRFIDRAAVSQSGN